MAKNVLVPPKLTAAASESTAVIHDKILRSRKAILIISNKETNDMTIGFALLIQGVTEATENEQKNK